MRCPSDDKRTSNESLCNLPKKARLSVQSSNAFVRPRSTILDLPTELSVKIFEYLSVRQRRNVKLVCRRWSQIFDETKKLLEDEKLICCDLYRCSNPSRDILQTLACSKREILNLEFHYFEFRESDSSLWQQCGAKIRELHFSECSLTSDTLLLAIVHCPNLTRISWSVENVKSEKTVVCTAETMDRLLSYRLTNANLTSLSIRCVRSNGLSNFVLDGLFALFPNVKRFAFWFAAFENYENEESLADSRTCLTLDCVLRRVRSLENVAESIDATLKRKNDRRNVSWDRIFLASQFKKLKEVTLDVTFENVDLNSAYSFFADQTHLESVRLRGFSSDFERSVGELCSRMLDSCPKLRHLRIESRAISLNAETLRKIVESRLVTLCIRSPKLDIDSKFCYHLGNPMVNTRLRTLIVDGDVPETAQLALMDTFRRLHSLELRAVTDEVLQRIWKYQIDLVSLKLTRAYYTTNYGFTGIRSGAIEMEKTDGEIIYSARRLADLEYLTIESVEEEWTITIDTLAELIFPKLRYLVLDVYINDELHGAFLDATSKLESLEVLSFKFVDAPFRQCYDICGKLTNLRYLRIRDDSENAHRFTDSQCQRLFKRRSSLRALIHECNDSTNSTYFFHVLEKMPKKKVTRRLHRLASEKIGIFFADCLWF